MYLAEVAEAREDRGNVSSLLHRDDAAVILLVDPRQSCLCVIVEDTSEKEEEGEVEKRAYRERERMERMRAVSFVSA